MNTYKTAEVAKIIGIHPNTVRLYEEWGLISKVNRQTNGYRVFTDFHIKQIQLARIALQVEVLQNGLRKKIVEMVKESAKGHFNTAIKLANEYLLQVQKERQNAEDAIEIVNQLLSGKTVSGTVELKRKQVSEYLHVSMDALRNWEMNGLLAVKRKRNGYRVYTEEDIQVLKIIRSLRCANYSLESILRMLRQLSADPNTNIKQVLNTPSSDEDIITACDKLIVSLQTAEKNATVLITMLEEMKIEYT